MNAPEVESRVGCSNSSLVNKYFDHKCAVALLPRQRGSNV